MVVHFVGNLFENLHNYGEAVSHFGKCSVINVYLIVLFHQSG
jgi:hypothetical protein